MSNKDNFDQADDTDFWNEIKGIAALISSQTNTPYKTVVNDIRQSGLPNSDEVIQLLKPSICLKTKKGNVKVGQSKLGGMPDLPTDISFPLDKNGQPYIFLGQVNLSEFKKWSKDFALSSGLLYFFIQFGKDLTPKERCKIIYTKSTDSLTATKTPADYKEENVFKPTKLKPHIGYYLPNPLESKEAEELKYSGDLLEKYEKLFTKLNDYYGTEGTHRLFGYPFQIQGDLRRDWSLDNSELLFQICCGYENYNDRFSDAVIYFGIDKQDLLDKKFDNVVWTMQMT